jgi:hypothetical protein
MGMVPEVTEFHCKVSVVGIMQIENNELWILSTQLQILGLPDLPLLNVVWVVFPNV